MGRKLCIYPALLTAEQRDRRVDASQFVAADGRTRRSRNETLWNVFPIFGRDFIPAA